MEAIQFATLNRDGMRRCGIAVVMACLSVVSSTVSAIPAEGQDVQAQVQSNYGKLPLSFELNQGQADAQVKFLARGQGYTLFLTAGEAVLSLKEPQVQARVSANTKFSPSSPPNSKFSTSFPPSTKFSPSSQPDSKFSASSPANLKFSPSTPPNTKFSPSSSPAAKFSPLSAAIGAVLRIQFVGVNHIPRIIGKNELPGRVNYMIGKDRNQWLKGVPTYAKVAYEGIYPGVDLVFYGNQGELEYDFIVAPGADLRKIKLAFQGADKIEVNPAGELILRAASGDIRMHKPVIYQEIDGVRKPVDGGFVLKNGREVGFQVAAYDTTHPLIIDPVLVYSTYLGGSGLDIGQAIAVDQRGQAYIAGQTSSIDFPTQNTIQPAIGSNLDAFVAQLSADGATLLYATYLGGSIAKGLGNVPDAGFGIAVDRLGQAYVTGVTFASDFPTVNAQQPVYGGNGDAFVAQLSADGAALRYATYLGGSGFEVGFGITVDQQGQAAVTGETSSSDFPVTNALQPVYGGNGDAFIAQLAVNGTALRYSTYLGGSDFERGWGIAVDRLGRVSVSGQTSSDDFPTENALQSTYGGNGDAFVAQLSANGAALRHATYLGGSGSDFGFGIAVDRLGRATVTGQTNSADFPTVNALQAEYGGDGDAYVAQLSVDGSALRYATYLGGSDRDQGFGIAVDRWGRPHVTGFTFSSDFPTENALQPTYGGEGDAFVAQLSANGAALRHATYLGGSSSDQGFGIAVDRLGQSYVTGDTRSSDFPTMNALQPAPGGSFPDDAFVAKIGNGSQPD